MQVRGSMKRPLNRQSVTLQPIKKGEGIPEEKSDSDSSEDFDFNKMTAERKTAPRQSTNRPV